MSPSANVRIMNNLISDGQGIVIANTAKAKVDGNSLRVLADGATAIHLAGVVTGSEVAGNTLIAADAVHTPLFGIHLDQSLVATPDTANKISGNTITSFRGTDFPGFSKGIFLESASHNMISGNSVSFALDGGIELRSSDFNSVSSNTVTLTGARSIGSGYGVLLANSNSNMLSKNVANDNFAGGIVIQSNGSATVNILKQTRSPAGLL